MALVLGMQEDRSFFLNDVEVKVDIWRKVPHVWQIAGFLPEAGEALERGAGFLRQHTPGTGR